MRFDGEFFQALIIAAVKREGGLRKTVAAGAPVTAPTLSRLQRGRPFDMKTFMGVCAWLEIDSRVFFVAEEDDDFSVPNLDILKKAIQDEIDVQRKELELSMELLRKFTERGT